MEGFAKMDVQIGAQGRSFFRLKIEQIAAQHYQPVSLNADVHRVGPEPVRLLRGAAIHP